jgi:hypothetical protein
VTLTSTAASAVEWKKITICSSSSGYGVSPTTSQLEGKPISFYEDVPADDHKIVLLKRTIMGKTEFDINTYTRGKWYSSQSEGNIITLGETKSFKLIYEQTGTSVYTYQFRLDDKGAGHLMWSQHYLTFGRVSAYYSACKTP